MAQTLHLFPVSITAEEGNPWDKEHVKEVTNTVHGVGSRTFHTRYITIRHQAEQLAYVIHNILLYIHLDDTTVI